MREAPLYEYLHEHGRQLLPQDQMLMNSAIAVYDRGPNALQTATRNLWSSARARVASYTTGDGISHYKLDRYSPRDNTEALIVTYVRDADKFKKLVLQMKSDSEIKLSISCDKLQHGLYQPLSLMLADLKNDRYIGSNYETTFAAIAFDSILKSLVEPTSQQMLNAVIVED